MLYLRIKWCFEKNKIIVIRIFKINQIQIYFYLFLNQTKYKNSYVSKHLDCQTYILTHLDTKDNMNFPIPNATL